VLVEDNCIPTANWMVRENVFNRRASSFSDMQKMQDLLTPDAKTNSCHFPLDSLQEPADSVFGDGKHDCAI